MKQFVLGGGNRTPVNINNGVYTFKIREIYKNVSGEREGEMRADGRTNGNGQTETDGRIMPTAILATSSPPPRPRLANNKTINNNESNEGNEGLKHGNESESRDITEREETEQPVERESYESVNTNKIIKSPITPTQEEMERHRQCGHCPFRSWCADCVKGRATVTPHM